MDSTEINVEMAAVTGSDGHVLDCTVFHPVDKPRGTVLVVQEIFGVTGHIRAVASQYAALGYKAIAPSMFDRVRKNTELAYDDAGIHEGLKIATSLRWSQSVRDLEAATQLAEGRIAAVGFCWGGTVTWQAAVRGIGLSAAVAYYGGFIPKLLGERLDCPVMLHWAEHDHIVSAEDRQAVLAAYPGVPQFSYDAEHGFNCTERGAFNAQAAALAHERTLAFLAEHIG
jgi:carboxymethylenebutenolidase